MRARASIGGATIACALATATMVAATVATASMASCGARTGLDLGATVETEGGVDAETDARAETGPAPDTAPPFDAAACPPIPTGWSESVVGEDARSYAAAADDRCSLVVVWSDASGAVVVSTLDEHGVWARSPLGVSGAVVATAVTGSTLHVLFFDGVSLHYIARRDGVLGAVEVVDPAGLARGEMVVEASGAVHAIYAAVRGTLSDLHHALRTPTGWAVEQVDLRQSFEPSLALAPDGKLLAAYEYVSSSEDHACVLARRDESGWTLLDLPRVDTYTSSSPCTVRVFHDGTIHLAYGAYGDGPPPGPWMRHAYGSFDAPAFENVEPLASFGFDPGAAALDGAGALHVAYRSKGSGHLKAATLRPPAPPTIETVSTVDSQGLLVVVDRAGVTNVVAYRKGGLVVARRGP